MAMGNLECCYSQFSCNSRIFILQGLIFYYVIDETSIYYISCFNKCFGLSHLDTKLNQKYEHNLKNTIAQYLVPICIYILILKCLVYGMHDSFIDGNGKGILKLIGLFWKQPRAQSSGKCLSSFYSFQHQQESCTSVSDGLNIKVIIYNELPIRVENHCKLAAPV